MIIVNNYSDKYFELNGVQFAKIYQPLRQGENGIGIYNIYDTRQQLLSSTKFDEFLIGGVAGSSAEEVVALLLDVVFDSRVSALILQLEGKTSKGGSELTAKELDEKIESQLVGVFYGGSIIPSSSYDSQFDGLKVYWNAGSGTYSNYDNIVIPENTTGKISKDENENFTFSYTEISLDDYAEITYVDSSVQGVIYGKITGFNFYDKNTYTSDSYLDTDTGNLNTLGGWFTSDFIDVKNFDNFLARPFSFIVFYNNKKERISGIGEAGQTSIVRPVGAKYFKISASSSPDEMFVKVGVKPTHVEESYELLSDLVIEEKKVIATINLINNAFNYNALRDLIDSIEDNSEFKQYKIIVPRGEWFESDLKGKPFVKIVGEDMFETILYCDGNSTKLTPTDYSFSSYANQALNTIPQSSKHCINVHNDIDIENLTIKVNDCKYTTHIDNIGFKTADFKNIRFIEDGLNVNNPVGMGLIGGQSVNFENCYYETPIGVGDKRGLFFHNSNNQLKGCSVYVKNSYFKNCNYLIMTELGSEHSDILTLDNCSSSLLTPNIIVGVDRQLGGETYWDNGTGFETNPLLVPYSQKIMILGTYVEYIGYLGSGYGYNPRPDFINSIIGNFDNIF